MTQKAISWVLLVAFIPAALLASCGQWQPATLRPEPSNTAPPTKETKRIEMATTTAIATVSAAATSLPAETPSANDNEINIFEAATNTVEQGGFPDWLEIAFGSLWVSTPWDSSVTRIDLKTLKVVARIEMSSPCAAMSVGYDSLWVANCSSSEIYRIDPKTNAVAAKLKASPIESEGSFAVGEDGIWVVTSRKSVTRYDPDTYKVIAEIKVPEGAVAAMPGFGAVWVTVPGPYGTKQGMLVRIDPKTNAVVATIKVRGKPRFLAAGEGAVWVLNQSDGTVSRIDPTNNSVVATVETGVIGDGGDIAVGDGKVWVRGGDVLLVVIDVTSNTVVSRYGPNQGSGAVRVRDGSVWLSAHNSRKIWRLDAK